MKPTIEFSASLLAANPLDLHTAITQTIAAGIKHIHFDIMDLHYVNNLGLNIHTLHAIHSQFPELTIDLHYMVDNIDHALAHSLTTHAQVRTVYFHPASSHDPQKTIQTLQQAGVNAGIAINPTDSIKNYQALLPLATHVLIMGVTPGFSGQSFQRDCLKQLQTVHTHKPLNIAIDGGINPTTLPLLPTDRIDHIVLGSALFNNQSIQDNIQNIHAACAS